MYWAAVLLFGFCCVALLYCSNSIRQKNFTQGTQRSHDAAFSLRGCVAAGNNDDKNYRTLNGASQLSLNRCSIAGNIKIISVKTLLLLLSAVKDKITKASRRKPFNQLQYQPAPFFQHTCNKPLIKFYAKLFSNTKKLTPQKVINNNIIKMVVVIWNFSLVSSALNNFLKTCFIFFNFISFI